MDGADDVAELIDESRRLEAEADRRVAQVELVTAAFQQTSALLFHTVGSLQQYCAELEHVAARAAPDKFHTVHTDLGKPSFAVVQATLSHHAEAVHTLESAGIADAGARPPLPDSITAPTPPSVVPPTVTEQLRITCVQLDTERDARQRAEQAVATAGQAQQRAEAALKARDSACQRLEARVAELQHGLTAATRDATTATATADRIRRECAELRERHQAELAAANERHAADVQRRTALHEEELQAVRASMETLKSAADAARQQVEAANERAAAAGRSMEDAVARHGTAATTVANLQQKVAELQAAAAARQKQWATDREAVAAQVKAKAEEVQRLQTALQSRQSPSAPALSLHAVDGASVPSVPHQCPPLAAVATAGAGARASATPPSPSPSPPAQPEPPATTAEVEELRTALAAAQAQAKQLAESHGVEAAKLAAEARAAEASATAAQEELARARADHTAAQQAAAEAARTHEAQLQALRGQLSAATASAQAATAHAATAAEADSLRRRIQEIEGWRRQDAGEAQRHLEAQRTAHERALAKITAQHTSEAAAARTAAATAAQEAAEQHATALRAAEARAAAAVAAAEDRVRRECAEAAGPLQAQVDGASGLVEAVRHERDAEVRRLEAMLVQAEVNRTEEAQRYARQEDHMRAAVEGGHTAVQRLRLELEGAQKRALTAEQAVEALRDEAATLRQRVAQGEAAQQYLHSEVAKVTEARRAAAWRAAAALRDVETQVATLTAAVMATRGVGPPQHDNGGGVTYTQPAGSSAAAVVGGPSGPPHAHAPTPASVHSSAAHPYSPPYGQAPA